MAPQAVRSHPGDEVAQVTLVRVLSSHPMINVGLFRVRVFVGAIVVDLVSVFALTPYLQLVADLADVER